MSNTSDSASGNNWILWAVVALVGLNLAVAWRFGIGQSSSGKPTEAVHSVAVVSSPSPTTEHGSPSSVPAGTLHPPGPASAAIQPTPVTATPTAIAGRVKAGGDRIRGRILLNGTPPPEKVLTPIVKDVTCGKLHTTPPSTRNYLVGSDRGLQNVFVYVKTGLSATTTAVPSETPLIDQKGCLYEPYVLGVRAGQMVSIRNSDPTMHNVNFAVSKAGNAVFNFVQSSVGQVNQKSFLKAEVFAKLQCNVHPWMSCYVGVVDHPFFAVTDLNGAFSFPTGLPPGKYVIEATHPKAGSTTQAIEVAAGGGAELELELSIQ